MTREDLQYAAANLYDAGWRSSDREDIMREYNLTMLETDEICAMLDDYEESEDK